MRVFKHNGGLLGTFGFRNVCFVKTTNKLPFTIDTQNMVKISYKTRIKLDTSHNDVTNGDWISDFVHKLHKLNENKPFSVSKKDWTYDVFKTQNLPTIIGTIDDKDVFCKRHDGKFLWTLDLPLKMPGKPWMIPAELQQFSEFIHKCEIYERMSNVDIDKCYAYFCVDQREVDPGKSQRRDGWHSDSFPNKNTSFMLRSGHTIKPDSVYLAYDCIPTEFCPGPFTLGSSLDINNNSLVLKHFEKTAVDKDVKTYDNFSILKMGPECVHRVGLNKSNSTIKRTFAKLVFSTEIFNREGNDHNYFYDYNWLMITRGAERNNSSIIGSSINGNFISEYTVITHDNLKLKFSQESVKKYLKTGKVKAIPAQPGELLKTELACFTTTYNVAKEDDWKITTSLGDQYFLSNEKLNKFYTYDIKSKMFIPSDSAHSIVKAIKIDEDMIQIMAPWGYPQYLNKGDYLVMRDEKDIYGVLKNNFEENYKQVSY